MGLLKQRESLKPPQKAEGLAGSVKFSDGESSWAKTNAEPNKSSNVNISFFTKASFGLLL